LRDKITKLEVKPKKKANKLKPHIRVQTVILL